jgi:tRNA-specific 2-thiouridylase
MSGGVDSSVAAALLQREGYDVVGCFMRLGSPGETLDEFAPADEACDPTRPAIRHKGCCSIGDAADARLVAAQLGIPFYVCNFKKDFGRIIDYFADEYASGRTPNPCVRCNDWPKFGKLHEYARQIGADFVASGHYARVDHDGESGPRLLRGVDASKDQSYVLFGAPRAQLVHMLLPIGAYEKARVREMAEEFGLPVFDKPDSQEICFVPDDDYASLVERRRPEVARAGKIVDESGAVVGEHTGQHNFTIGQRRGVGVALGYPIYVVDKNPQTNTVTIGVKERLLADACVASEANWLVNVALDDWRPCRAQHRYNSEPMPARFRVIRDGDAPTHSGRAGRFEVEFDKPQSAVTPGQAIVLYDDTAPEVVIGGGWIESSG